MAWSDERVAVLKKMWLEGNSASEIAKELGNITRNAVIGKVHRLGLSNRDTNVSKAGGTAEKSIKGLKRGRPPKINTEPKKRLKEFRVKSIENYKEGNEFGLEIFNDVKFVDIRSKTIGKGFAGAMKRHNFSGLRATHGVSVSHRSHGSTGQRQDPGKVFKGKKMAGHMGDKLRTMQNIEIIKSDLENNLLYLKGSIPGSKNSEIMVKGSVKNISKLTIEEKIAAAEQAKKTPDKKKK